MCYVVIDANLISHLWMVISIVTNPNLAMKLSLASGCPKHIAQYPAHHCPKAPISATYLQFHACALHPTRASTVSLAAPNLFCRNGSKDGRPGPLLALTKTTIPWEASTDANSVAHAPRRGGNTTCAAKCQETSCCAPCPSELNKLKVGTEERANNLLEASATLSFSRAWRHTVSLGAGLFGALRQTTAAMLSPFELSLLDSSPTRAVWRNACGNDATHSYHTPTIKGGQTTTLVAQEAGETISRSRSLRPLSPNTAAAMHTQVSSLAYLQCC